MSTYSPDYIRQHFNWLENDQGLSGKALETKFYEDAKQYGISSSQIDEAMGWGTGVTDNWSKQNGLASLASTTGSAKTTSSQSPQNIASTQSASVTTQVPSLSTSNTNKGLLQTSSEPTFSNTFADYSPEYIQQHFNWLENDQGLTGQALENKFYQDAKANGVTAAQIDEAMGWGSGITDNWITNNGLPNLTGNKVNTSSSGLTGITSSEINDYISYLTSQGLQGDALYEQLYSEAKKSGLTSDRLAAVMNLAPGDVQTWIDSQGLTQLQDNRYQNTGGESATGWQTSPYVNPLTNQVTSDQTVSGQLSGLLSQDSPLMQRAKYQGIATANSRGLLNSSLAAGAAQAAMIDAALPVAQQDAQTYYDQSRANQDVQNEFYANNLNYLQGAEQSAIDRAFDQTQNEYQTNAQLAQSMAETRLTQSSGLYAQFIQGMADINSSDMEQSAKDVALRSLWETISKGTELSTSLANVTFADGQLVYGGSANDVGSIVTAPETRSSDQPSIYWGDGGYYAANITRNSAEQIVDREGNVNPDQDNTNNYYLTTDGEWKKTVIRNVYKD